jgi:2'-5' RNA ligase
MGKPNYISLDLDYSFTEEVCNICLEIQQLIKNCTGHEFIPMEQHSLHMTLCFLGDSLQTDRKNKMKIVNEQIDNFSGLFSDQFLTFDRFSLFPETKKNLVVAIFKSNDPSFIQKMTTFKREFVRIGAKEEDFFVPHITLGKIQNMNLSRAHELDNMLRQIPLIGSRLDITGCSLV